MTRQAMAPRLAIRTFSNMRVARSVPDDHLKRRRVVGVAGVVELGTVGEHANDVTLGAEFDVVAGRGDTVGETEPAVGGDGYVHEEIDVWCDVALAEVGLPGMDAADEAVAAAVHVFLAHGVAHGVALARAG